MINVSIELDSARTGQKSSIGKVLIFNDGTGTEKHGNYVCKIMTAGEKPRTYRKVRIENFPRKKLLGVDLLYLALKEALKDRDVSEIRSSSTEPS